MTEMYRNPRLDIPASVETQYMGGAIALMRRFDFHIRTRPKDERVVWVGKDL